MLNRVDILHIGYTFEDEIESNCMRANCTSTLIRTCNGRNIIVDTMTAWDGARLTGALLTYGLQPTDIHAVVCTHGHSDHIGCNYLFKEAKWHIVGACVSHEDKYLACFEHGNDFELDGKEVVVKRTPGHTLSCVSVLVRNTKQGELVGVVGDLFERLEDIMDESIWLAAGSEDVRQQREQRLKMAEKCAYIVPGHGTSFVVTEQLRQELRKNLNSNC